MDAVLSVVVMAFDEVGTLADVVRDVRASLRQLDIPAEVLVVDDGSTDGTGPLADRLAAEDAGVRALHHPENRGLGGVYRTAFAVCRGEWIALFPGDGQFPAAALAPVASQFADADLILGAARSGGRPLVGRLLSRAERLLLRVLCGPLPRFQGIVAFRRALLERFPLRTTGRGGIALFELILRAQRDGCRIVSVPTELRPRRSGSSKVQGARTVLANLRQAVALRRFL